MNSMILSALALLLGTAPAFACTPIVSLPTTITTSGTYCLSANLSVTSSDAITVQADFVTIDFRGYTISGPGYVEGLDAVSSFLRRNLIIRNGAIRGFENGVIVYLGTNTVVENMTISDVARGIFFAQGAHNSARSNRIVDVKSVGILYSAPAIPMLHNALDHNTIVRDNQIADVGKAYGAFPTALGTGISANGYGPAIIHNNAIAGVRGASGSRGIGFSQGGLAVENKIVGSAGGIECATDGASSKAVRNVLLNGQGAGSYCLKYDNF